MINWQTVLIQQMYLCLKHAFLNKDEFFSGIKLDKELCREHFRNV